MMAKEIKITVNCKQNSEDIVVPSDWSIQRLMKELEYLFGQNLRDAALRSATKEIILKDMKKTLSDYYLSHGEYLEVLEEIKDEESGLRI